MEEKILAKFHPTRLGYIKFYVVAFILFVLGALLYFSQTLKLIVFSAYHQYAIYPVLLGLFFVIIPEVKIRLQTYIITTYRVIDRAGIFNISENVVYWNKIASTNISQSVFDRIFDIGSIDMWSMGGSEEPEITLVKIANVKKVQELIDRLIEKPAR
jgi:uncharacterized membrane protein YdbT with pleckstrin-like domain